MVPFVNVTFEWEVEVATLLTVLSSCLSIVPV